MRPESLIGRPVSKQEYNKLSLNLGTSAAGGYCKDIEPTEEVT